MTLQKLATEMEAIKLFMKEQFYLLKTSVLEINSNTDTANNNITEIRDLFRQHRKFYNRKRV